MRLPDLLVVESRRIRPTKRINPGAVTQAQEQTLALTRLEVDALSDGRWSVSIRIADSASRDQYGSNVIGIRHLHEVTLGYVHNFTPETVTVRLKNTTEFSPREVRFEEVRVEEA